MAAGPPPETAAGAAALAEQLQRERAAAGQLAQKEGTLLGRLTDLERQIELESRALRAAQTKLRVAQTRLSASDARARAAVAEVQRATQAIGPRLTARYRMGREGYLRFLLGARSIGDVLRRNRLFSALLERDFDALAELRFREQGVTAARDELAAARDELARSAAVEVERRAALDLRVAQQKRMLASVQQEKAVHEQAARELEEAARALAARLRELEKQEKADQLEHPPPAEPAAAAPPGDAAHPAPSGPPGPAGAAGAPPGSTAAAPAASGATGAARAPAPGEAAGAPAESAPAERAGKKPPLVASLGPLPSAGPSFKSARGRLLFPVELGHVEVRFGRAIDPRFGTVTLQRGIDVRAPEGTPVHAVHDGKVVHAGWFKGYGNLIIVDHGAACFSLMAHLASLERAVGDEVKRGDRLGTVGDTGSLKGAYLYFELRDGQKPLDPDRWLSRNRKPGPLLAGSGKTHAR